MDDTRDRGRGEGFIDLYNKLDAYLRRAQGVDRSVPFMAVVRQAAQKIAAVKANLEQIQSYAELRNAIVHGRGAHGAIIADPRIEAVEEFSRIVGSITAPKKLLAMASRDITIFGMGDPLARALQIMHSKDYSQVVVNSGREFLIVSTEGVARWLESRVDQDIISVADATVADAVEHEPPSTAEFVGQTSTVHDGYEVFQRLVKSRHPRVFAILITATGKNTEKPLGIVTPWDLFGLAGNAE